MRIFWGISVSIAQKLVIARLVKLPSLLRDRLEITHFHKYLIIQDIKYYLFNAYWRNTYTYNCKPNFADQFWKIDNVDGKQPQGKKDKKSRYALIWRLWVESLWFVRGLRKNSLKSQITFEELICETFKLLFAAPFVYNSEGRMESIF